MNDTAPFDKTTSKNLALILAACRWDRDVSNDDWCKIVQEVENRIDTGFNKTAIEVAKTNLANCKRHHAEKLKEWEEEKERMYKAQERTNIAYREIRDKIRQLQDILSIDWE